MAVAVLTGGSGSRTGRPSRRPRSGGAGDGAHVVVLDRDRCHTSHARGFASGSGRQARSSRSSSSTTAAPGSRIRPSASGRRSLTSMRGPRRCSTEERSGGGEERRGVMLMRASLSCCRRVRLLARVAAARRARARRVVRRVAARPAYAAVGEARRPRRPHRHRPRPGRHRRRRRDLAAGRPGVRAGRRRVPARRRPTPASSWVSRRSWSATWPTSAPSPRSGWTRAAGTTCPASSSAAACWRPARSRRRRTSVAVWRWPPPSRSTPW